MKSCIKKISGIIFILALVMGFVSCKPEVVVTDTTAPASVTNVNAESEEGKIVLTWTDPSDSDLLGIKIYNGTEVPARAASFSDGILVGKGIQRYEVTNLEDGKKYTFRISAVDNALNESKSVVTNEVKFSLKVVEVSKYVCPRDGKEYDTAEEAENCCGPLEVEKIVYTTSIQAGTYTVYHLQQNTSGGKAFADYTLYATENSKAVAENSTLENLKKTYAGFTAKALAQNESVIYVFYDRNTITIKYLINAEDDEPYAMKTGLYDTEIEAVSDPTKENKSGYHFNYWTTDGNTKVTPATICPANDVVYIANWHQIKNYTINYSSALGTALVSKTIECHTPLTADYLPRLEDVDNDGTVYAFKYWNNAITGSMVLKGQVLSSNISLVAVWGTDNWYETPVDAETGNAATAASKYIYFGVFPKTVLPENSAVTVDETKIKIMGENTYYKGNDGNYYAKVTENCYDSSGYTYSDGTTAKQFGAASTRYFKVEPIKWKVLTADYNGTGRALLLAEDILIANVPYYVASSKRTIGGNTVYANNYKYSTIRAYLNGAYESNDTQTKTYEGKGFLQTAFTANARLLIVDTEVDNSAETTGYSEATYANDYYCENTTDKIFLLSESEVINSSYGFAAYNSYGQGNARIRVTTDYAKANYAYQSKPAGYGGCWWLRSPSYGTSTYARTVNYYGGTVYDDYVYYTDDGVVPALSISF